MITTNGFGQTNFIMEIKIAIRFIIRIAILISFIKIYLHVLIIFQQLFGLIFLHQINGIGNNIT